MNTMKSKTTAILALTALTAAVGLAGEPASSFKDDKEKASYAVGLNMGGTWKRQDIELDYEALLRGLNDARQEGKALLNEQEIREVLNKFQQDIFAKQKLKRQQLGEKNKGEGDAFLADNKGKAGVITLPSGLQYKVITDGSGSIPKSDDIVEVNYRGTLIDGTEFDSSAKAGKPATFRVNGVIKGWTEALGLMKAGSKWQLFIPPNLAYAEAGSGQKIGPNATLLFDLELVSVQPAPPPAAPAPPLTSDIIKVPSLEEMKKGAKIETIKAEDVEKLQKQAQEQKTPEPKSAEKK